MELNNYKSSLNIFDTQRAIKFIKDEFINRLSEALNLRRVTAPLFVYPETGLNDNLNGYERPVKFDVASLNKEVEIVQSLAKWKRYGLAKYHFPLHEGLYTDMNAIRRDEKVDFLHSIYVDQWDWEKVIEEKDRNLDYLKETVKEIYKCIRDVNSLVSKEFDIKNNALRFYFAYIYGRQNILSKIGKEAFYETYIKDSIVTFNCSFCIYCMEN